MIKAFFLDFYGTVVHEDGEIVKKISQLIYETGKADSPSEIDSFWWNDFQDLFSNSHGNNFQTQRELEKKSIKHTLEKFASNENVEKLSNYMFQHWVKPPVFEESKAFFEVSPVPIYIVSNIDTNDVLKAIDFHQLSPVGIFTSEDAKAYNCCKEFDRIKDNNRQKTLWVYINRNILLRYDENKWKNYIKENLNNNWDEEIFQFLYEKILTFDEKIKEYYENKFREYASGNKGKVYTYPDHKADAINYLIILVLLDIANEEDIGFMRQYSDMSQYLEFIFKPDSFDYKNIKISDTMWCNFINNKYYRKRILEHRSEFWNKDEEKRIELGFGSSFENRVAYKYLFD